MQHPFIDLESLGIRPAIDAFWQQQRHLAKLQAASLAKRNQGQKQKSIDGVGEKIANIPAIAFHFWGQKLGYACWNDKEFMEEFLRDNPECRVKCEGTKLQVGFGS